VSQVHPYPFTFISTHSFYYVLNDIQTDSSVGSFQLRVNRVSIVTEIESLPESGVLPALPKSPERFKSYLGPMEYQRPHAHW